MILLWVVSASVTVGLVSLIGVFFLSRRTNPLKITSYLISLASGTMLGGALLDLIPEAVSKGHPSVFAMIGLGVFMFFVLEKFFIWRHCHLHHFPEGHSGPRTASMILAGDAVHNFIDGAIIASAFLASINVGISVSIAILLHEIPQEIGDFAVLIQGGYSPRKALTANLLIAVTSVVGAVATFFFVGLLPILQFYILPVAAGGLLYIALADLIPQLHEQIAIRQMIWQILLLALGFGVMILL